MPTADQFVSFDDMSRGRYASFMHSNASNYRGRHYVMFEQTKGLFQTWLMYGIGTLFAMAMLSFVTSLVLQVTARVKKVSGTISDGVLASRMTVILDSR
jgi:hypothetical protein